MSRDGLVSRIEATEPVLAADPAGRLPLRERRLLLAEFGPCTMVIPGGFSPGWLRTVQLYRWCAERVRPHWQQVRLDDARPQDMLDLADRFLAGRVERMEVYRLVGKAMNALTAEAERLGATAFWAGLAATYVASAAIAPAHDDRIPLDTGDEDLDSDSWAPDYVASLAEGQEPQRRREYWRWYLREAVPAAYAAVADG